MATTEGPLFPFAEPIAGPDLVTPRWRRWFLNLRNDVSLASVGIPVDAQLNQGATIPTTPMDGGNLSAGLYLVSWYLEIVTAAGATSVQVSISWESLTVSRTYAGAVLSGAVATNNQPNERALIYVDAASPITYSVTYVGAGMTYNFRPVLQSVANA